MVDAKREKYKKMLDIIHLIDLDCVEPNFGDTLLQAVPPVF